MGRFLPVVAQERPFIPIPLWALFNVALEGWLFRPIRVVITFWHVLHLSFLPLELLLTPSVLEVTNKCALLLMNRDVLAQKTFGWEGLGTFSAAVWIFGGVMGRLMGLQ